jgi:hypothetical protein
MPKIAVDWSRTRVKTDAKPAIARYRRYYMKIHILRLSYVPYLLYRPIKNA